jgi:malonyl-CoA/methylmalonyl-CoA synthetase
MVLYLATLRAGYVFLPLNTAYQSAEIEYFIGNAEPAVVVCSGANFGWVSKIAFKAGTQHVFTLNDDRTGSLLERAAHQSDQHRVVVRKADDLAAILYTSGTTGRSKGAMLTHGNMLSNARTLKDYWGWTSTGGPDGRGDVLIHALPIFHVHGLFVAIHGALINGSKMIWMAKFDPKRVIAYMAKATVFMGVPTLYVRMLAEPSLTKAATQHMRLFIAGSAPLLIETFTEWQQRTGHTILERYGMSETAMLTSNPYAADKRYANQSERRGGTVGFPLPGVSLQVLGEDGRKLPVGEIGGIQVQGPNVFKGYWRMPEKTAEEFTADGYFKTGDVGKVDERGYVTIVGRSKDLIISGGYNVYPAEIEGYINEMKGVAESAVVGVQHPDFGEVGVAVVIGKPGAALKPEAILAELKANLANFKIPKRCFVVAELPRNTMGKVQKNLLREQYKGLF